MPRTLEDATGGFPLANDDLALPCPLASVTVVGAGSGIRTHEGLRHGIAHPRAKPARP